MYDCSVQYSKYINYKAGSYSLQRGWSSIMVATKNGHVDIVHYLVDHGSNVQYTRKQVRFFRIGFCWYITVMHYRRMAYMPYTLQALKE